MREEHGKFTGDLVISEPFILWGAVTGNVRAIDGAKLYVRGVIYGNLDAETRARVHVYGNISGNLTVMPQAKVIHSGVLGGNAINRGGRLYVEATAQVLGKVITESGRTELSPPPK